MIMQQFGFCELKGAALKTAAARNESAKDRERTNCEPTALRAPQDRRLTEAMTRDEQLAKKAMGKRSAHVPNG